MAVHDTVHIGCLKTSTVILYAAVIKHVRADLGTPFYLFLTCLYLFLLGHAVLQFLVIQYGTQVLQGTLLVLGLVTGLGVFYKDLLLGSGIGILELVTQTYARFNLVHVLTAGTTTAECIPTHKSGVYVNLYGVINKGCHKNAGK